MDLTVFVPTRGRTKFEHITLNELRRFTDVTPVVVCPPSEALHYRHEQRVDVWASPVEGIGPVRQWILEQSPTRGVLMLDDDLYFSHRPDPNYGGKLERVTDLRPLLARVSDTLDAGFIHGGISARQGNQNIGYPHTDCIRVNNAHFFDRDAFAAQKTRFDALPVMEDFYVTLSLLTHGYPNRVIYEWCWSQRGSGFKGGCSLYRTPEVQATAAEALHMMFPDFVKVVEKTSDSQAGVMAARTDVNIAWLKAWERGRLMVTPGYTRPTVNTERK